MLVPQSGIAASVFCNNPDVCFRVVVNFSGSSTRR